MSSVANTISTRSALRRGLFAALTTLLLAASIAAAVALGAGWWQLFAFGLGPDVALLAGAGAGLAKGLGIPHLPRSHCRLREAHARRLPACLSD